MKIEVSEFWELLKEGGWQGYIWRVSDTCGPTLFKDGKPIPKPQNVEAYNRIQEANFYNERKNTSLHVKQIDGIELAYKYEIGKYDNEKYKLSEELTFDGSKENLGTLKFKNLYQLKQSEISSGAESWIQIAQIFIGFKSDI